VKRFLPLALISLVACSAGSDHSSSGGLSGGLGGGGGSSGTQGSGGGSAPSSPLATGLPITEIAVFQGVKIDLFKDGVTATSPAVVAGRRALVRVYVTPGTGYTPHAINGVLTVTTGGTDHTFMSTLAPSVASSDEVFSSTFNFDVDAASIGADSTFLVRLEDPTAVGIGDPSAQFPASATPAPLGAQSPDTLKISLFPIHFTAGSAGTPATGATDIAAYQAVVMSMYPTASVAITVEATLDYSGPIPQANGANWDQLLNAMIQRRGSDPAPDVYYYAAFAPSPSFDQFCGAGCVAGLSSIPQSPSEHSQKASIGLVYGGDSFDQQASGVTMAHEIGHGHGREHSPTVNGVQGCSQPTGIDPAYPYPQGDIGVWGYDPTAMKSYAPTTNFDLMGYCPTTWISDYTYTGLLHWMTLDNGADIVQSKTPTMYRQIVVHGDGTLTVGASFPVYGLVAGTPYTVTYQDGGGTHSVTGHYYPYDHIPGGYLLAPEPAHFTSVTVPDFSSARAPAP
jgi:hypothetical protein